MTRKVEAFSHEPVCEDEEDAFDTDNSFASAIRKGHSSPMRVSKKKAFAKSFSRWFEWAVLAFGLSMISSFFLRNSYTAIEDHPWQEPALPRDQPRSVPTKRNMPLTSPKMPGHIEYIELPARIRPWPGPIERRTQFEAPELVRHDICGGCRLHTIKSSGDTMTCGHWMDQHMKAYEVVIAEAGVRAAKRFPTECKRCDPSACSVHEKDYWPLDAAAPRVLASRSLRLSIPEEYRIPEEAFDDLEKFFQEPENQHPYLFEWNPSVIVLPGDQIPERHKQSSPRDTPVYLATFRVTKQQNCFRTDEDFHGHIGNGSPLFKSDFVDLAGIALLRADFSIVEEAFFDLRRVIKRDQDMRLFVFPPEKGSKESRIYIAAFHEVSRLWLRPPEQPEGKRVFYDYFEKGENPFAIFLEDKAACCTSCSGKNFNYFLDSSGRVMVETLPMAPHTVEYIDFHSDCDASEKNNAFKSTTVQDPFVPKPSFSNTDELYFMDKGIVNPPYSLEHGTACCIRIPDPRNEGQELLVGVSHSKTLLSPEDKLLLRKAGADTESRQYISRFYAFEPKMPYRVVALSGAFCMPFPTEPELKENYNNKLVKKRPYQLGDTIDCPYITFLSGITEKANDPFNVLISYGMNDCTARIAEVSKLEISMMLFDPLSRLNSTWIE
jgi:hypothetical protein